MVISGFAKSLRSYYEKARLESQMTIANLVTVFKVFLKPGKDIGCKMSFTLS